MFVRAYIRASTQEQDAERAKGELIQFAEGHGHKIAAFYIENESGASLQRPELMRLINEAHPGDVILCEQVDRLSRLATDDWEVLKAKIKDKCLSIVSQELPTSHIALLPSSDEDFCSTMMKAINDMLLDMLAAIARKDYEDRRRRQSQGIAKAKSEGKYKGRPEDTRKQELVKSLLRDGKSYREVIEQAECSRSLVAKVSKQLKGRA